MLNYAVLLRGSSKANFFSDKLKDNLVKVLCTSLLTVVVNWHTYNTNRISASKCSFLN